MSTCPSEIPPLPKPDERRQSERLRVTALLPAHLGRGEGAIVDLSLGGARLRHSVAARRGARTRIKIFWQDHQLAMDCEVLASRVADIGTADTPTLYETRVRFLSLKHQQIESLARLVAALRTRDLRKLVSNLKGWHEPADHAASSTARLSRFVRLTRDGNHWNRKRTSTAVQPPNGFLLPAETDEKEILLMCQTWEKLDHDGRHLLRRMAEAALEN